MLRRWSARRCRAGLLPDPSGRRMLGLVMHRAQSRGPVTRMHSSMWGLVVVGTASGRRLIVRDVPGRLWRVGKEDSKDRPQVSRGARVVGVLVSAVCLLGSCSTRETPNAETTPDHSAVNSSTPSGRTASPSWSATLDPARPTRELPAMPATDNVAALAHQLNRAAATLRAGDAGTREVRTRRGVPAARDTSLGWRVRGVPPAGVDSPASRDRARRCRHGEGGRVAPGSDRASGAVPALADRRAASRVRAARVLQGRRNGAQACRGRTWRPSISSRRAWAASGA